MATATAEETTTTQATETTAAATTEKPAETTATAATTAATSQTTEASTTTEATGQTPVIPDTYDLALPKDSLLAAEDVAFVATEAKALGLTNAQAQHYLEARSQAIRTAADTYLTEAKADPTIGGARWDETLTHATAGLAWVFPDQTVRTRIQGWFDRTGLGNHKDFLGAMARIGKARAEDTPVGGGRAPTKDDRSFADRFYEPKA